MACNLSCCYQVKRRHGLHQWNCAVPLRDAAVSSLKYSTSTARAACVMPAVCRGFSANLPCFFSAAHPGRPAWSNRSKNNRRAFCNDAWMAETCLTVGGRRNITRSLKAFRAAYEEHPHIYNAAMMRVPDEWRETFHAVSLEERRRPANKPRGAPASSQATAVNEEWQQLLTTSAPSRSSAARRLLPTRSGAQRTATGWSRSSSWTTTSRRPKSSPTWPPTTLARRPLQFRNGPGSWSSGAS